MSIETSFETGSAKPDEASSLPVASPSKDGGRTTSHVPKKRVNKSLLSLLNDACKYSAYSEYSMPSGFLRRKGPNSCETTAKGDGLQKETQGSDISSSSISVAVRKQRPASKKRQAELLNNGSNENLQEAATKKRPSRIKKASHQNKRSFKLVSETAHTPEVSMGLQPDVTSSQNDLMDHGILRKELVVSQRANSFIEDPIEHFTCRRDLFDSDALQSKEMFEDELIHSRSLSDPPHVNPNVVKLRSILYPDYEEEYIVDFSTDLSKYNPMSEIGRIIEYTLQIYVPTKFANQLRKKVVQPLNKAFDEQNQKGFIQAVEAFNELVKKIPRADIVERLRRTKAVPTSFFHSLLHMVYVRTIHPKARSLKEYRAFSNNVYGELLPNFLTAAYAQCGLKPGDIFMDLGSGVGNCVLQAALEFGCSLSFGCELMPSASDLTTTQESELQRRCRLWGLKLCPTQFSLRTSFVNNSTVDELLPKCDVLLINNFIFDAKLNLQIQKLIQVLKPGCKVISLKNLRPFGYTINFDDVGNIMNRLTVKKYDLPENSVSWTHRGGEYYISTVGEDIDESIFTTHSKGRVRMGRRVKYTR
ncbi:histone methyltransferase DOT1 [Lachancea thermotolerans CBS 6340]|uniref:Histone-lysine N-methyltransferase, H3 lysine-79 specific n=1 Tax=Lachancea thermotolerans (strain ATCC 56472 / CBS 6340 / NRRL Y-8284) TaxID=559295 RepID=C5DLY1_LACTC|nr:KLTH0G04422p [Lachancea thermotolerans CBS 6340]CAR24792.1 KLTH0G04422p [Lachancea thermotolerans CBS 6340]